MAATSPLPYVTASGNVTKVLNKIKQAETPPTFTTDFLKTTLDMSGGSARPVIPFLKRTGFLGSDGSPTELYKRFRNPSQSGAAGAEALRTGYKPLYSINEYIHDAKDSDLKGAVVQSTGLEDSSGTVTAIVGSFKALKAFADFKAAPGRTEDSATPSGEDKTPLLGPAGELPEGLKFGYTINLHLPPTSDVAVFNAIFKSLREHLLR
jgi:hypothetical protein